MASKAITKEEYAHAERIMHMLVNVLNDEKVPLRIGVLALSCLVKHIEEQHGLTADVKITEKKRLYIVPDGEGIH